MDYEKLKSILRSDEACDSSATVARLGFSQSDMATLMEKSRRPARWSRPKRGLMKMCSRLSRMRVLCALCSTFYPKTGR